MSIPKNALGQDVPTTFENANHFWTYEKFAYHFWQKPFILWLMVGLTFLDLGAENSASSAPPAAQDFFRGARQFPPGPLISPPSMLCGSNFLQRFLKNGDTPQSDL